MNKESDEHLQIEITRESIERLISELSSGDVKTRERAHLSLLALGDAAIPYLVESINNKNRRIRWEATKTLAEMRRPVIAPVLADALDNPDEDVRWLAAEGLLALGIEGLPALFKALVKNPTSTWLLQGAHHIVRDLYYGRAHPGEEKYLKIHYLGANLREKVHPVLLALDGPAASLQVPLAAKAALEYMEQST